MSIEPKSFKSKVVISSIITVLGFGGTQALRLIANLILARILFPEAFGIMAIVNVIMIGLAMFSDIGTVPAIVQNKRGEEPLFLNTAWSIQIIRGFVLWSIACLIAWPASVLYGQDILFPLICVTGLTAVIDGFQTTAVATAPRKLQLGRLTLVQTSGQFLGVVVMITLAWLYQSVWALVIGALVASLAELILGHLFLPSHKHRPQWDEECFAELTQFGKWIFMATVATFVGGQGLLAVQGTLVSTQTLGLISIATALAMVINQFAATLSDSVLFPALSTIARDRAEELGEILNRIRVRLLALALPAFIGLSLAAPMIINILYDDRYSIAGTYLAILAIAGAIELLPLTYQKAYLALGNSRMYFQTMAISSISRIVCMVAGHRLGGIEGMLLGLVAGSFLSYLIVVFFIRSEKWMQARPEIFTLILLAAGVWLSLSRVLI